MQPRVRVGRADALVVEGRLQELALHRLSIGAVVGALTLDGLEVHRPVVVGRRGVARRQDLPGPHVGLAARGVAGVEPLVEDRELVAAPRAAAEVDVPGEDLGEVLGQLAALAELLDRGVEAGGHEARDAHAAAQDLRVVLRRDEVVALAHQLVVLRDGALVAEALDVAVRREHEPVVVAGLRVAEVDHRGHLPRDHVDAVGGDPADLQRLGEGLAAPEGSRHHAMRAAALRRGEPPAPARRWRAAEFRRPGVQRARGAPRRRGRPARGARRAGAGRGRRRSRRRRGTRSRASGRTAGWARASGRAGGAEFLR